MRDVLTRLAETLAEDPCEAGATWLEGQTSMAAAWRNCPYLEWRVWLVERAIWTRQQFLAATKLAVSVAIDSVTQVKQGALHLKAVLPDLRRALRDRRVGPLAAVNSTARWILQFGARHNHRRMALAILSAGEMVHNYLHDIQDPEPFSSVMHSAVLAHAGSRRRRENQISRWSWCRQHSDQIYRCFKQLPSGLLRPRNPRLRFALAA